MTEKKKKKTTAMYGAFVDLTGVVISPRRLRLHSSPSERLRRWTFPIVVGAPTIRKKGQFWSGDGRSYCVAYANPELAKVKTWFEGILAQQQLLRASLTEGK